MAKKKASPQASSARAKKPAAGKNRKPLIIVIVLILIILGVVGIIYRDQLQSSLFSPEDEEGLMENIAVEEKPDIGAPSSDSDNYDEYSDFNESGGPGYYVRIAQCIFKNCIRDTIQLVRPLGLPTLQKKSTKTTLYYELISLEGFSKQRALDAIDILSEQNGEKLFLVPHKGEYRISFGLYPDLNRVQRIQSKLAQMYPDFSLRFVIKPKKNRYTATSVFIGPLLSMREARYARKRMVKKSPEEEMIITTNPR